MGARLSSALGRHDTAIDERHRPHALSIGGGPAATPPETMDDEDAIYMLRCLEWGGAGSDAEADDRYVLAVSSTGGGGAAQGSPDRL